MLTRRKTLSFLASSLLFPYLYLFSKRSPESWTSRSKRLWKPTITVDDDCILYEDYEFSSSLSDVPGWFVDAENKLGVYVADQKLYAANVPPADYSVLDLYNYLHDMWLKKNACFPKFEGVNK
jgi:hypothetical protein